MKTEQQTLKFKSPVSDEIVSQVRKLISGGFEMSASRLNGDVHEWTFTRTPQTAIKQTIISTIDDLAGKFLYYDRKEDETLSIEQLNKAIKERVVTVNEIVDTFKAAIEQHAFTIFNE